MEVVGAVASIVQLAEAAFNIMKVLDTIKEGGQDRRKLCDEITVLWMILRNFETQFSPVENGKETPWMGPITSLAAPSGVLDQLEAALTEVYVKVTRSESKAGKIKQTLRWPLDKTYVDRTVAHIERLKSSIVLVASQANIAVIRELREDVSHVKQAVTDQEFKSILDWLSPLNCREKQSNITATPGTGDWFFTSDDFKNWMTGNDRWLWCHGVPGAGKTFLASSTVAELERQHKSEKALVLVLFCSYDTADSQSIENLVASLLKQVVQATRLVPTKLQEKYKQHSTVGSKLKLDEIREVLNDAINASPKTYIVLDALDELIEDSKRTAILGILYRLPGNPKILVTSRELENIAARFGTDDVHCDGCQKETLDIYHHCEVCYDFDLCQDCRSNGTPHPPHPFTERYNSLEIQISAQPDDIATYLLRRIDTEEDLNCLIGENHKLREEVLDTIIDNAKDMFLLARFHMDALAECLTLGQIEEALACLPQGINDTYNQAMERIEKLSPNRRRAVKKMLQWVSYSKRPLTIKELEHAVAVSYGARELRSHHVISAKVLTSLSAGIIIVDENERVRLTHKTAEDYFADRRATLFARGDAEITETCLAYLQLSTFESGPCYVSSVAALKARLKEYPFYGYASLFWAHHARSCDPDIISPQALLFLRKKPLLEASVEALWYLDTDSDDSWDVPGGIDALHLASYFGLNQVVTKLLQEGADPNVRDSLGRTPLVYSCCRGHLQVTEMLLAQRAAAHLIDHQGSTALLGAVRNRHLETTQRILLEKNVEVDAFYKPWDNYTALMIAATQGDTLIMEALLKRPELDINLICPLTGLNCLMVATLSNQADSVEVLLRHPEIDLNHQDNTLYTATHYAALRNYVDILSLLLSAGADPSREDDQGGRPLQRAIDFGRLGAVELLLKHNVDYTFKDMLGRTILHAAAVNGQAEILRHILENCKDLDIDGQGDRGETALHDATEHGYIATVQVLIEFGARSDTRNKAGFTPVRLAREWGLSEILDLLREARKRELLSSKSPGPDTLRKADTFEMMPEASLATEIQLKPIQALRTRIAQTPIETLNEASSSFNSTLLHLACEASRLDAVEVLLEAGVFVDPMDSFHRTPFIIACQRGDLSIARALIAHGADLNHSKFSSDGPWERALRERSIGVALYLLTLPETKVDTNSRQLSHALGWAAAYGELEACRRLVGVGAPLLQKNEDGLTPLQIAREWQEDEAEAYLAEQEAKQRMALSQEILGVEDIIETKSMKDEEEGLELPQKQVSPVEEEFTQESMPPGDIQEKATKQADPQDRESYMPSSSTLAMIVAFLVFLFAVLINSGYS